MILLSSRLQGGGSEPGYEAKLPFNGQSYPGNPTLIAAVPERPKGEVVVPKGVEGELLYD